MFYEYTAAVFGSIEKWRDIMRGGPGCRCSLCRMDTSNECILCPIGSKIMWELGEKLWFGCMNTPFETWAHHDEGRVPNMWLALAEMRYLEELFDDLYFQDIMGGIL